MKAVRYLDADRDIRIGRLTGSGTVRDAGPSGPAGFVPSEDAWAILSAASGPEHRIDDIQLLHPVNPGKIIAIGLNYRAHADESELAAPSVPIVFAKFASSLVGHEADVVIPREETRPDFEGELAVVIGRSTYRATTETALDAVGGISALNDVSGRRAQLETPMTQFTLGKSFDTFTPMGPSIADLDGIDLANVDVRTIVSGEIMQTGNTRDLLFSVAELIIYVSAGITLYPGDVIATGTPSGVGNSRTPPRYLHDGDIVEIEVGGVGRLRNKVRAEADTTRTSSKDARSK